MNCTIQSASHPRRLKAMQAFIHANAIGSFTFLLAFLLTIGFVIQALRFPALSDPFLFCLSVATLTAGGSISCIGLMAKKNTLFMIGIMVLMLSCLVLFFGQHLRG